MKIRNKQTWGHNKWVAHSTLLLAAAFSYHYLHAEDISEKNNNPTNNVQIIFPKEPTKKTPDKSKLNHTPAVEIQQLYYSDPGKEASKVINLTIKRPNGLLKSKTEVIPASAKNTAREVSPFPIENFMARDNDESQAPCDQTPHLEVPQSPNNTKQSTQILESQPKSKCSE